MYLIDVSAVDGDSGIEEIVSFALDGNRVSMEHKDAQRSIFVAITWRLI